jgi:hypothetical protein
MDAIAGKYRVTAERYAVKIESRTLDAARRLAGTGTLGAILLTSAVGCATVTLQGGDKPIHIVHDINIRVDRQLDEFFAFENQSGTAPATQPVSPVQSNAANGSAL